MVGVPRSKGCRICVQRRVRCDLTRPTCNNCNKGNRPCPGYDSDLKFQDEGERLRKRFAKSEPKSQEPSPAPSVFDASTSPSSSESPDPAPWSTLDDSLADPSNKALDKPAFLPHRNSFWAFLESQKSIDAAGPESALGFVDTVDSSTWAFNGRSVNFADQSQFTRIDSELLSPSLAQDQLLHLFAASLTPRSQALAVPQQLRNYGRWISYLPSLTGRDHLLDTAVRAVTLAHLARLHGSDVILHESRPYYGKAIRLLNSALSDVEKGMASETLSATMLLSFYEMFASDSDDSWIRHAGGAGALMRVRGPQRHRYGFDREIFLAFRHTIVIEAFQGDDPCFLNEPEWRALSQSIHEDIRSSGIDPDLMELFDLTENFYEEMLVLPASLHDSKHTKATWKKHRDKFPTAAEFKEDLIRRCNQSRTNLKAIYARLRVCMVKLGYDRTSIVSFDPIIPIYYSYPNVFVASTCIGYWTVLIVLNAVLMELESSRIDKIAVYKVENRECGLEICRSTSYLLTSSFLGPFFNIFGLRVSLMAFEQHDERDWVIQKLFEIGQTHMAMAKHIPGFRPGEGIHQVRAALSGTPRVKEI